MLVSFGTRPSSEQTVVWVLESSRHALTIVFGVRFRQTWLALSYWDCADSLESRFTGLEVRASFFFAAFYSRFLFSDTHWVVDLSDVCLLDRSWLLVTWLAPGAALASRFLRFVVFWVFYMSGLPSTLPHCCFSLGSVRSVIWVSHSWPNYSVVPNSITSILRSIVGSDSASADTSLLCAYWVACADDYSSPVYDLLAAFFPYLFPCFDFLVFIFKLSSSTGGASDCWIELLGASFCTWIEAPSFTVLRPT